MALKVLLVQSDEQTGQSIARLFVDRGDQAWQSQTVPQALELLTQEKPDLLVLDLHFPGSEWLALLKQVRQLHPGTKIMLSNKYPDLQRELLAAEHGATVIFRQPFSRRWLDQAVQRVFAKKSGPVPARSYVATRPLLPRVKVPVRIKITLPYLLLALLFALSAAFVVSQIVIESVQARYLNQLIETGRKTSDWMVRQEDTLLSNLRLIANSQGTAKAISERSPETLYAIAFPLAVNARLEGVDVLDGQGISLISLSARQGSATAEYQVTQGDGFYRDHSFILQTLLGKVDEFGDKYSGLLAAPWGNAFSVSGPVYDSQDKVVGAVLVSQSLQSLAQEAGEEVLAEVTLYDLNGQMLASTFPGEVAGAGGPLVMDVLNKQEKASRTRSVSIAGTNYVEVLGAWEARDGNDLGLLGVSLAESTLVRTSSVTQLQIFILVALGIILVIGIGLAVAGRITRPLVRLAEVSSEVAQGNLEVKVDSRGNDEIAVLAHSFNQMIAGLQEGSVYRDLLGRTVSPEVREQLRQTFTTGGLRLEGQEAVATVLMTDIRSFTALSERADPATVLNWLNEYFGLLVPIITAHGGVVNKFDGDAMLAFFGILPRRLSSQEGALAACRAAVEMIRAIDQLNAARITRGEPPLVTGIGVNTGVVIAGGLGTSDRLHYTIIGDAVNTAQRLETLTRQIYSTSGIIVSNTTYVALAQTAAEFNFEPAGHHLVKGKSEQLQVYRLEPRDKKPLEVML